MNIEVFKDEEFSKVYQAKMFPISTKVPNLVISYLEEKKGRPFELVVDAGCGTGRSTRPLSEHFCKVTGIDMSESQINEARKCTPHENITYQVSTVEKMPLEDASVDLINVDSAAHWFAIDQFFLEVTRVLKSRGCVALHCLHPKFSIQYKDCSETLTSLYNEAIEYLSVFEEKVAKVLKSQYQEMFVTLPFSDKKRVTDITEVFHVSLEELLGFLRATCMCHKLLNEDRAAATDFLQTLEKKMTDALGDPSGEETLEFHINYFCILGCKS